MAGHLAATLQDWWTLLSTLLQAHPLFSLNLSGAE
jgi:hypothetical protein